jgi:hypothetical protein
MISLDNNAAGRGAARPVVTRKNAHRSGTRDAAPGTDRHRYRPGMAGLNILAYLTAYPSACGRDGGEPPGSPGPGTIRDPGDVGRPADLPVSSICNYAARISMHRSPALRMPASNSMRASVLERRYG